MVTSPSHDIANPVLVDCDTGIDDSLALLHLLSLAGGPEPLCTPVAIVCTAGNIGVTDTVRNTLAWLDLMTAPLIPVAQGASEPIEVWHPVTPETHGPRGVGYAQLPEPNREVDSRTGAQLWVDAAREYPGELTAVLLGPASTLAGALELEPNLPFLLRRLVVMGGTFTGHPGNTTAVSEWNVHVDPEAADRVCQAWQHARRIDPRVSPVLWCGLNVTEAAELTPRHLERLPDTAVADQVRDALRFYFEFHHEMGQGYLAHIHDPACVHLALTNIALTTAPAAVRVECAGQHTRGMTVADYRIETTGIHNADVVTGVNRSGAMAGVVDDIVDSLCNILAPERPHPRDESDGETCP